MVGMTKGEGRGGVFKSLIPKEAIGGGFSNPRSKLYSNGFPSFSCRALGPDGVCSQSCRCWEYGAVKCSEKPRV